MFLESKYKKHNPLSINIYMRSKTVRLIYTKLTPEDCRIPAATETQHAVVGALASSKGQAERGLMH